MGKILTILRYQKTLNPTGKKVMLCYNSVVSLLYLISGLTQKKILPFKEFNTFEVTFLFRNFHKIKSTVESEKVKLICFLFLYFCEVKYFIN